MIHAHAAALPAGKPLTSEDVLRLCEELFALGRFQVNNMPIPPREH